MADLTLNRYIASGTTTQRLAFTPSPASPSSGPSYGEIWWDTTLQALFAWDAGSSAWVAVASSGTVAASAVAQIMRRQDDNTRVVMINQGAAGGGGGSGTVTSVAIAVPSILTVSGSPITTSGTITLGLATGTGAVGSVLLGTVTASASASLDMTSIISASYDQYMIQINDIIPASNGVTALLLFSTNNGSTWSGSTYNYTVTALASGGGAAVITQNSSGSSFLVGGSFTSAGLNNTAGYAWSATIYVHSVNSSSLWKRIYGYGEYAGNNSNATSIEERFGGAWETTTAVTALQLKLSSGNITSGNVRVYGLSK